MNTFDFDGATVIVTGGAGGFGAATARGFANAGANVVVADINLEAAQAVAASLQSAIAVKTDVTVDGDLQDLSAQAVERFGGIDVLVNNAGAPNIAGPLEELDAEKLRWLTAINYESVVLASKYAIPHLRKSERAAIVNVASISARRPRPGHAVYCSIKGGVEVLTRAMAVELAPKIRVNSVSPVVSPTGFVKSATGEAEFPPGVLDSMVAGIPLGRHAVPEDVAKNIMYLASDVADFLTGVTLEVDGGRSIA